MNAEIATSNSFMLSIERAKVRDEHNCFLEVSTDSKSMHGSPHNSFQILIP